jgi:hypothetical protein
MRLNTEQKRLITEAVKMNDVKAITELIEEVVYCMDHDMNIDRAFYRIFNRK